MSHRKWRSVRIVCVGTVYCTSCIVQYTAYEYIVVHAYIVRLHYSVRVQCTTYIVRRTCIYSLYRITQYHVHLILSSIHIVFLRVRKSYIFCTENIIQPAMYAIQCTTYNARPTMYDIECTTYNVQHTMYNLKCTTYRVRHTTIRVRLTTYKVRHILFSCIYHILCNVYVL